MLCLIAGSRRLLACLAFRGSSRRQLALVGCRQVQVQGPPVRALREDACSHKSAACMSGCLPFADVRCPPAMASPLLLAASLCASTTSCLQRATSSSREARASATWRSHSSTSCFCRSSRAATRASFSRSAASRALAVRRTSCSAASRAAAASLSPAVTVSTRSSSESRSSSSCRATKWVAGKGGHRLTIHHCCCTFGGSNKGPCCCDMISVLV